MEESAPLWFQIPPQETGKETRAEMAPDRENCRAWRLSSKKNLSSFGLSGLLHSFALIVLYVLVVQRNEPRPLPPVIEMVTMVTLAATIPAGEQEHPRPPPAREPSPPAIHPPPQIAAAKVVSRPSSPRRHTPKIVSEQPLQPTLPPKQVLIDEDDETPVKREMDDVTQPVAARTPPQVTKTGPAGAKPVPVADPALPATTSLAHRQSEYNHLNLEKIRKAIAGNLIFPSMARKMGWKGRVVVSFAVLPGGRVADISVVASSGRDILDRNVVLAVEKSAPFPPAEVAIRILLPISFNLQ